MPCVWLDRKNDIAAQAVGSHPRHEAVDGRTRRACRAARKMSTPSWRRRPPSRLAPQKTADLLAVATFHRKGQQRLTRYGKGCSVRSAATRAECESGAAGCASLPSAGPVGVGLGRKYPRGLLFFVQFKNVHENLGLGAARCVLARAALHRHRDVQHVAALGPQPGSPPPAATAPESTRSRGRAGRCAANPARPARKPPAKANPKRFRPDWYFSGIARTCRAATGR